MTTYRVNIIAEVEADKPGDAITKALSGEGNVKQANAVAIPRRPPVAEPAKD